MAIIWNDAVRAKEPSEEEIAKMIEEAEASIEIKEEVMKEEEAIPLMTPRRRFGD